MFWNQLKTALLLSSLSGLLFLIGLWAGGKNGLIIALVISLLMNFVSYFWSDKIVLSMYGAQELDPVRYARTYEVVQKLSRNANIPMPKLWYINTPMANAFATGRNPENGSVAVTQGILDILDDRELTGVLAHEISHIKNRDILIATVAATIATAIGYLANMLQWAALFGSATSKDEDKNGSMIGAIVVAIIMPIAAMLIQMAISRSREYLADESGANISDDPLALASALKKLETGSKIQHVEPESPAQTATASLFIVYPFSGSGWINLFSTHPPMEERIKRLQEMAQER